VKSLNQLVRKKTWAAVPLLALAPEVKVASLAVIAAKVPFAAVDQERSPIGLTPASLPTYVQLVAFCDLIFRVQLRFALIVKVGPALGMTLPASTSSAVGLVSEVVAELMPSLTSAPTVTEAVFVVLQLPALPLHCAEAWLAQMAVPSTIAARRLRVAFIVVFAPRIFWECRLAKGGNRSFSSSFLRPFFRVAPRTYKTKTDPSCNRVFTQFSEGGPLTFLSDSLRKISLLRSAVCGG